MSNLFLAMDAGLEIIPVLNKIDLPGAEPEKRARYDQYGHQGVEGSVHEFHDVQDIFDAFGDILGSGYDAARVFSMILMLWPGGKVSGSRPPNTPFTNRVGARSRVSYTMKSERWPF